MSRDESIEEKKASRKEFAKKMRREAYLRAKEFKKNDPREIARKEEAKAQRREMYQKSKERYKAQQESKSKKEKVDLSKTIHLASELDMKSEEQPMGEVITVDFRSRRPKR